MSVLFHTLVGPFTETTFVLFYDRGDGAFNLRWDTGPEWRITEIVGDDARIFKFLPGEAGEIRVDLGFGNSLLFEARAIPVFGSSSEVDAAHVKTTFSDTVPVCFNLKCGGHPCPDEDLPDLRCPGGNKECYQADPP